jgi:hypothetical protein
MTNKDAELARTNYALYSFATFPFFSSWVGWNLKKNHFRLLSL